MNWFKKMDELKKLKNLHKKFYFTFKAKIFSQDYNFRIKSTSIRNGYSTIFVFLLYRMPTLSYFNINRLTTPEIIFT